MSIDTASMQEQNLAGLTNTELLQKTTMGPTGTGEGSHLEFYKDELVKGVKGAWQKLMYDVKVRWVPAKAAADPLNEHFGPNVHPSPDNRVKHDDPLQFNRNDIFEREGKFIHDFRNLGAETIGEFQTELDWWKETIHWHTNGTGRITAPIDRFLVRAYEVTLPGDKEGRRHEAIENLQHYAEEVAFYKMAVVFVENQPELVERLLNNPNYPELKRNFIDAHIGASGASEETIATAMIAGHYLLLFEDKPAQESQSQKFITNPEEYHATLGNFLTDCGEHLNPPRPTGERHQSLTNLEKATLKLLEKRFLQDPSNISAYTEATHRLYGAHEINGPKPNQGNEKTYLENVANQMYRFQIDQEIIRRIHKRFPHLLYVDPKGRRNLVQTVIGNIVMATTVTDEGREPTASRWMVNSEGYIGKDRPEKPDIVNAEKTPTDSEVVEIVKDIFNGQPGISSKDAYKEQTRKIYDATPLILKYLQKSERVPEKIREMLETVTDQERLAKGITSRYGPKSDNDVNTLNRFYREGGLPQAQKYLTYRLIFEFLEGVNTNLILKNSDLNRQSRRIWKGSWENDDFTNVPEQGVSDAIAQTLKDGENQLLLYDHDLNPETKKKILKLPANRRMSFEKYLWDTYDIWFKRHVNKRGAKDNFLEIAIECICPRRDTIFNPRTYHQY